MAKQTMILFTNWLNKNFIGKWAGEKQVFKPGQSIWIENWKAKHYAKHLVDQHFNKLDMKTDHFTRKELEEKCIAGKEEVGSNIKSELYNKNLEKPATDTLDEKEDKPEKEFEDLNEKEGTTSATT